MQCCSLSSSRHALVVSELRNQVILNESEVDRIHNVMQQHEVDNNDNVSNRATRSNSVYDRRSTLMPSDIGISSPDQSQKQVNVVTTERLIDESMQMKGEITVRSLCWLTQTHTDFNLMLPEGHAEKPLIMFLSKDVKLDLIRSEQQKKIPNASLLNVRSINKMSDEEVYQMFARKIRPNSRKKFNQDFIGAVRVKFKDVKKTDPFTMVNYHIKFHAAIHDAIDTCQEIDEYFRLGADPRELSLMPPENWGKSETPGVFRLVMEVVAAWYADEFTGLLGLDLIMACKDLKAFCTLFQTKNHEWATISEMNSELTERAQKPMKLNLVRENVEQKKILSRASKFSTPDNKSDHLSRAAQKYLEDAKEAAAIDEAIRSMGSLNIINSPAERFALSKMSGGTKKLPCYVEAFECACPNGNDCGYSHDKLVLKEFLRSQNAKIHESPLWEPSLEGLSTQAARKSTGPHPLGNRFQMVQELKDEETLEEYGKAMAEYAVRNFQPHR